MAQVITRGRGRHLVRVFLGRDPATGRRRYHNKTIRGTKKQAEAYGRKIQTQVDSGTFREPTRQTVAEFLDHWFEHTARRRVHRETLQEYKAIAERHLKPVLGKIRLGQLTPEHVQQLVTAMEAKKRAPRTIRNAHGVLRNALSRAVREGTIPMNPASAKLVDLPKTRRRELTVLSPKEAAAFVEAARGERWGPLFILLLGSGMRPGEALGLQWSDFEGSSLRIRRALVRSRDGSGKRRLKEPKTRDSRRTVPLPDFALEALRTHRRRQAEEKLRAGAEYEDRGLIFADERGAPLSWRRLTKYEFPWILEEAGLPKIRAYDLRHTCATLLLSAGVNPKVVSERLGHTTVTLTLDTYSSVLPGLQEDATAKLGAMLS
jgi:integrase